MGWKDFYDYFAKGEVFGEISSFLYWALAYRHENIITKMSEAQKSHNFFFAKSLPN